LDALDWPQLPPLALLKKNGTDGARTRNFRRDRAVL
jgi:hypothetical protein